MIYINGNDIKISNAVNFKLNSITIDLKLSIEELNAIRTTKGQFWIISLERPLAPKFGSFIGPLVYLSVSHDKAVKDYHKLLDTQISEEFRETALKLMELM